MCAYSWRQRPACISETDDAADDDSFDFVDDDWDYHYIDQDDDHRYDKDEDTN